MDRIIKLFQVFLLGLAAGLPLPFTLSTLSLYLADNGVSLDAIGLFSLVGLPYTWKFLWSPLIDNISIPYLKAIGHRKSWLLIIQMLLAFSFFTMSSIDITTHLMLFAINVFIMGFLSATQDILIDALRIEMLKDNDQARGASSYTFGYRIALLISSAGVLYMAQYVSWKLGFIMIASLLGVLIFNTLSIQEKAAKVLPQLLSQKWLEHSFIAPFKDFMQHRNWYFIILFVAIYRLSDAYIGMMTGPFYKYLGFNNGEIASIVKIYGVGATLFGTVIGGYFCSRKEQLYYLLVYSGILAALTNFLFIVLYYAGHNSTMLMIVVSLDNFAGAMANVAFLTYISLLCNNKEFTATQFALLSSLGALGRTTFSSSAGIIATNLGWVAFFIFSAILAVPGLMLIKILNRKVK